MAKLYWECGFQILPRNGFTVLGADLKLRSNGIRIPVDAIGWLQADGFDPNYLHPLHHVHVFRRDGRWVVSLARVLEVPA